MQFLLFERFLTDYYDPRRHTNQRGNLVSAISCKFDRIGTLFGNVSKVAHMVETKRPEGH